MMDLLVATRSGHKLREIRSILAGVSGLRVLDLNDADIPEAPEEEGIEAFDTFEANAAAKAHHFARISGLVTVSDDSGLVVDALGGRPGVHSKRFAESSNPSSLVGEDRDRANTEHLLSLLGDLPLGERTARYVCVAVLVEPSSDQDWREASFRGEAEGLILGRPRGWGGFGYDPVFYDSALGKTFAEIREREKSARSHRGKAFRALGEYLVAGGLTRSNEEEG